jgi:hypothetical protein
MAILLWPLTAVIIGALDVALTARVAAGLHLTGHPAMPAVWRVALLLPALLPAGYAGAAGLAMYLSPGHGFWPWGRLLAGPLLCVGAGQAILILAIGIAAHRDVDGVVLGAVTGIAGSRVLWSGAYRGGLRIASVRRGEARPRAGKRLGDLLEPG